MNQAERIGWYWHRFRAMGAKEIAGRLIHKVRAAAEPSAARGVGDFQLDGPPAAWPRLPDRTVASTEVRDAVRIAASSIREGRWLLFGWKEIQVPNPPAWHHDFANSRDAPADAPAQRLNYRHLPSGADARCVWEINRWAEMVLLAQNAWLNGALDDARLGQRWLFDWCESNPAGTGVNWCSPLEAGIRLINFCWFDALIRGCEVRDLSVPQDQLAQRIVPVHAWWAWRHRSFGSSANNHLLGELSGVVLATRRWPSLTRLVCRPEVAWRQLATEILRQFAEDGGNREQALHYHHFAWELAWQAHQVMGGDPGPVSERLRTAAGYFSDLVHGKEPWDFGDCDDAQITPFASPRQTATAEWKGWLRGEAEGAGIEYWLGKPPAAPSRQASAGWKIYPVSGLAAREVNGWKARVDGSPLGFGRMAAHGHLDAMHVSLWHGDHALVIDPGTGTYFGAGEVRAMLASWEWHNGPLPVQGRAHPRRAGAFLWTAHHSTPALILEGDACVVRFVADGLLVSRGVRYFADGDAWEIADLVPETVPHVVRWRLAPAWRVESQAGTTLTLTHPGAPVVTLSLSSSDGPAITVDDGLVSPHFGAYQRGAVITATFMTQLVSRWEAATPKGRP